MATLALTAIGSAMGGPIGSALGSLIGQSIDQGLFGAGSRNGPKLGDLSIQTSSYGSPVPRIYGTMRVAGTVVWATDLKEEETTQGGGKSGPERQGYCYSVSLAVAVSSRPIKSVRRIWADGKLVRGAAGDFKVKTKFRLARGGEDQLADPLIASIEGITQAPAYRGLALAIFEDLELADFGNRVPMLTFEIVADDDPLPLSALLNDASSGLIVANELRPLAGFAAHGVSIRDSLAQLIDMSGALLTDRANGIRTPTTGMPALINEDELGCEAEGEARAKTEIQRAPVSSLPVGLAMTYYDWNRDYQIGQMRASIGGAGTRYERVELPAVLDAGEAKRLAEAALARRWQSSNALRLRLPPSRMALRPGDAIRLAGTSRSWIVRSVLIDGMAIVVEAEPAPTSVHLLPADPGRSVSEPDAPIGRSELMLFELPGEGDTPDGAPRVYVAASNDGPWKSLPVALQLGSQPLTATSLGRRAVLGRTETALDARCPTILDELSAVVVRLANNEQLLLNSDCDALMAGANLALVGDELIQFGRAEQLGAGLYRVSKFLRGLRGTEWAATTHGIGEGFCLIERSAFRSVELNCNAVGALVSATAHGIGDFLPLPMADRVISGEAMRPPSPCHLRALPVGEELAVSWTRRSHGNWAWGDGIGDSADSFPELYRVSLEGPAGETVFETADRSILVTPTHIPGQPGQPIAVSVVTVGSAALSRPASTTILL